MHSSPSIPSFESPRLLLRPIVQDDFESWARFYADPGSKFYGGPLDRRDAWRKFVAYPGHWALRGYGPWALEEKATGVFVGISGLWYPEGWVEPEITWALLTEHHGKGYATEAGLRSLRAAYEHFGWTTAISVVDINNRPSAAVATRMGATLDGNVDGADSAHIYRHQSPKELGIILP